MEFSTDGSNPQDNETTMLRKWVQYSSEWAEQDGVSGSQQPDSGDNTTTLLRKFENTLHLLATA